MANWFIKIWDYDRKQWTAEIILPMVGIAFTWGLFVNLYQLSFDKTTLVANRGRVSSIAVVATRAVKSTDYPLIIELEGYPDQFRITEWYKKYFPDLQSRIMVDDTITVYTRNRWQTTLCWGHFGDVYEIDKGAESIFPISRTKAEERFMISLCGILALILWVWYILYRRRKLASLRLSTENASVA